MKYYQGKGQGMKKAKVLFLVFGLFCLFWASWAGASERLVLSEMFTNTS